MNGVVLFATQNLSDVCNSEVLDVILETARQDSVAQRGSKKPGLFSGANEDRVDQRITPLRAAGCLRIVRTETPVSYIACPL
jgi:hypothetical protein